MSRRQKFLTQLLSGRHDHTLDFATLCQLLVSLGFEQRIRGSHHLFARAGIAEIINLQPTTGHAVKPYQAKQVRAILLRNRLLLGLDSL